MSREGIVLRDYQKDAVDDIWKKWGVGHKGVLLHFATGTGKTVVMSALHSLVRKENERILFIAHLRELLDGASETFKLVNQHDQHWFERGEESVVNSAIRRGNANIVFAMVQSLHRRLGKYPSDYFQKIFIDETHRSIASTYRKIVDHFTGAQIVGVTATPKRRDNISLGELFDVSSDCSMSIIDGIELGWLAPFRPQNIMVESLDYSDIELLGKQDYTNDQIEKALQVNGCKPLYEIAAGLHEKAKDLQTIVFVSGVGSAQVLARIMREDYHEPVDFIYGGTDYDVRSSILDRYRRGSIKRIINVGVLTEGVDLPNTQCVAVARATTSVGRYLQMAGRGTRPFPLGVVDRHSDPYSRKNAIAASIKPDCLLLDFKGQLGRLNLAVDGMTVLSGMMPHRPLGGGPVPTMDEVVEVGKTPEYNGKSIEEIRQEASDRKLLEQILNHPKFRVKATIKDAEVQEFTSKTLFGLPKLTDKTVKKFEPLPVELRAEPDQRASIIRLREEAGIKPPTTEYLLTLTKDKARRVIGDLVMRIRDFDKWIASKRGGLGSKRNVGKASKDSGIIQAAGGGTSPDDGRSRVEDDQGA